MRSAKNDLRLLRKTDQVKVLDQIEHHLTHEPGRQSKSRIKRLRVRTFPPYRLRIDEFRVYDDVNEPDQVVVVYGVVSEDQSEAWLEQSAQDHLEENER